MSDKMIHYQDEHCPKSKDGNGHCVHWWDCGDCCWCGKKYKQDPDCDCDKCMSVRLAVKEFAEKVEEGIDALPHKYEDSNGNQLIYRLGVVEDVIKPILKVLRVPE